MGQEIEFNGPFPNAFYKEDQLIWDPDTLDALRQFARIGQQQAPHFFQMVDPDSRAEASALIMMDSGKQIVEAIRLGKEVGLRRSFATIATERGIARAARGTVSAPKIHLVAQTCAKPLFAEVGESLAA